MNTGFSKISKCPLVHFPGHQWLCGPSGTDRNSATKLLRLGGAGCRARTEPGHLPWSHHNGPGGQVGLPVTGEVDFRALVSCLAANDTDNQWPLVRSLSPLGLV